MPAAGPLIVRAELLMKPQTRPPTIAVKTPLIAGKPLAFLRQAGDQKVLVVVQPKLKASALTLKGLKGVGQPLLVQGLNLSRTAGGLRVSTKGVGYGVFRLG